MGSKGWGDRRGSGQKKQMIYHGGMGVIGPVVIGIKVREKRSGCEVDSRTDREDKGFI